MFHVIIARNIDLSYSVILRGDGVAMWDTVKPQTIIQQNAVIGTVAVDGWVVTFGTARRVKR